jgi:hypothetical protein
MLIKSKFSGFLADGTRTPFMGAAGLLSPVTDLIFGKPPAAPPAPDYRGAAQETAAGNLAAAQAATAANRVSQYTPYGNLVYTQTGVDSQGNPTWRADQSLAPAQQQLLDIQNQTSLGLEGTINSALGRVQNTMGQGFNPNLPGIKSDVSDLAGQQGWDRATNLLMQRLQPQMNQQQEVLDVKLANQGIVPGTEAYNRAQTQLAQQQNDMRNQAALGGAQLQNQFYGQGLQGAQLANQANQQAYTQAMTNYNLPLNTLSSLRSGSQVQNPSFVNVPQQANTSGADLLGASQMGFNAQMGDFNAKAAERNAMIQGLFSIGGAAAMKSDIRTKENIQKIGIAQNGLPVYVYEYKPEFKDDKLAGHGKFVGHMAHEVEEIYPNAVKTLDDGYKVVDYGLLS